MIEIKGQRTLTVAVDARLDGVLGFISSAGDLPRDHVVESLLLIVLAGEVAFTPDELELLQRLGKLLGFDLRALAKERLGEGFLTVRQPLEKPAPRRRRRGTTRIPAGAKRSGDRGSATEDLHPMDR